MVDNDVRVLDGNGNLTVSTVEELTNAIKSEYPFLVDGSQAAGGGANGSSSGAGCVDDGRSPVVDPEEMQ